MEIQFYNSCLRINRRLLKKCKNSKKGRKLRNVLQLNNVIQSLYVTHPRFDGYCREKGRERERLNELLLRETIKLMNADSNRFNDKQKTHP